MPSRAGAASDEKRSDEEPNGSSEEPSAIARTRGRAGETVERAGGSDHNHRAQADGVQRNAQIVGEMLPSGGRTSFSPHFRRKRGVVVWVDFFSSQDFLFFGTK
jgi:hypothetical protein